MRIYRSWIGLVICSAVVVAAGCGRSPVQSDSCETDGKVSDGDVCRDVCSTDDECIRTEYCDAGKCLPCDTTSAAVCNRGAQLVTLDLTAPGFTINPASSIEQVNGTFALKNNLLGSSWLLENDFAAGMFTNMLFNNGAVELVPLDDGLIDFANGIDFVEEDPEGTEINGTVSLLVGLPPASVTSIDQPSQHPENAGIGGSVQGATVLQPIYSGDFDISFDLEAFNPALDEGTFGLAIVDPVADTWSTTVLVEYTDYPEFTGPLVRRFHGGYGYAGSGVGPSRFRIFRVGSDIVATIGGTWVSNPYSNGGDIRIGLYYVTSSNQTVNTKNLTNWTGYLAAACAGSCYVTTSDSSQISTLAWTAITGVVAAQTVPVGTSTAYLVSFDGRTTWKTWDGSAWTPSSLANLQTEGMTASVLEALTFVEWSTVAGFEAGTTVALDLAMALSTTDWALTPTIDSVAFSFEAAGDFVSRILDAGEATSFGVLDFVSASPTVTIDFRAGGTPTPDANWTSWLIAVADGASLSALDGMRYLQYRVHSSTADPLVIPSLDSLRVEVLDYGFDTTPGVVIAPETDLSSNVISGVVVEQQEPIGTSVRWVVSNDSGATWRGYIGSDWAYVGDTGALPTSLNAFGNTEAELEAVPAAAWSQFCANATGLTIAFSLATTDSTLSPSVSGITFMTTSRTTL